MAAAYFDYAAATPLDPQVLLAMQPYLTTNFYNPSALYGAARESRQALETARTTVAAVIGARPSEIIFTAGGTESDNLAIRGVMERYPQASVITSAIEHEAVLAPAGRYTHKLAPVSADGRIDMDALARLIDDSTVLISVMYANNEIGTVQPIRQVAELIATVRRARRQAGNDLPLLLHSDACQAANYLDLHVARLGVDLLTLNGSKLYGPKQSGILYVRGGIVLTPLIDGGGQERGLRSGTENVAACVGFAVALRQAAEWRTDEGRRLSRLQADFLRLLEQHLPEAIVNGSLKYRLPNNLHLTLPGTDNERLLIQLDEAGIQAAAGSACSASSDTPSHVLRAIGLNDTAAQSSLRFSMGRTTTVEQVERVVDTLRRLIA